LRAREDHGYRLKDELVAIAALIEAHRAEFEGLISAHVQRREWREKKVALGNRRPPGRPRGL
jgi:hypothetical protein